MEDKLTLFRQQAAIISRKKESTAEKLNDVRVELQSLEEEVKDKKSGKIVSLVNLMTTFKDLKTYRLIDNIHNYLIGLAAYAGESVPLRGDDFKRYVNSLRGKVRRKRELIRL